MENFEKLSDQNLYELCKTYGARALEWRRKFIGLLPEVFRRKLFEKKGFDSIFEFAKKLAGLSEEQVRLTLNLEKRFEKLPKLKNLLIRGEVSINKLARVVAIATDENQEFLAENVKLLSKTAVETLVRNEKFALESSEVVALQKPLFNVKSLPGQTLKLSFEVENKLIELQEKGININELLLQFLQKREEEISEEKAKIRQEILQKEEEKAEADKKVSRYIPNQVRKILQKEYGKKCSIKNCTKAAQEIHHIQRFSISRSHDPQYLQPLCRDHHQIIHAMDFQYFKMRSAVN
ncbi:HNH endonuclease [Candidatus Gracilibacteria bacterium]|nr:HNH endonuclease [Candidatus Gracilibacteria bacterium]